MSELSRRELLELAATVGLAGGLPAAWAQSTEASPARLPTGGKPRNIVFMVADGMSLGVPSMAEEYSRRTRKQGTNWFELLANRDAARGFFTTESLNSLVTDSAAASTAWASGSQVFNGSLNVLPDGQKLTPIARLAHESGRRVGLVTTTTITHATPAGFAAIQPSRDDEDQIAPQYKALVDVLLGGGRKFFDPKRRSDKADLFGEYEAAGYTLWDRRQQVIDSGRPEKVLGLFAEGHIPMSIDQQNIAELGERTPTLAEMTRAALDILGRSEPGFLLQVEGGRVDHAAHGNDAAALLRDQLAFDDAIGIALAFARERGDTLVVVTSDHGNSNPGLNGMGGDYKESAVCLERVANATASFEWLGGRLVEGDPAELIEKHLGVQLVDRELEAVREAAAGRFERALNRQHAKLVGVLGQVIANHFGIGWTGTTHTQDWVLLSAFGPGAGRFEGIQHLTGGYARLTELWNIAHRNPQMTAGGARRYMAAAPATAPHWL
jgi:alkaline phosphatase